MKDYISVVDKESNKTAEILKIQHISTILIFIAHATISDASKELMTEGQPNDELLKRVFTSELPSSALKQIADITLQVLDKIIKIPSEWIKAVTPILLWMSLHTEDELVNTIFSLCPTLHQEFSRLH